MINYNKISSSHTKSSNDPFIQKKAAEITERLGVVQEMVKGGADSYSHIADACAFELSDGKSVYELSEEKYQQLVETSKANNIVLAAGDPTGSIIGNYNYGSLNMFISEVGSSMAKDFSLTPWFPDVPVETLEVQVDRKTRIAGTLPEHDYQADLPTQQNINTYAYKYEGVRWSYQSAIGARDMLYIRQKGAEFYQRGIEQKIAYEGLAGMIRAFTTRNVILSNAIFDNGFTYAGIPVGSGIPSANTYTFSQPLGTYNTTTGFVTPNPNCNPIQEIANALAAWTQFIPYRGHLRQIVLNQRDYSALSLNPNFQALFGNRTMTNERKKFENLQKELFTFAVPQLDNVEFMVESEQWMQNDANGIGVPSSSQYFIPSGYAFMGLDVSEFGGRVGAFHLTPAIENGGYANPQAGIGVQVYDMTTINPGKPQIIVQPFLNGGPAIYMPEAIFIINFNYTIV